MNALDKIKNLIDRHKSYQYNVYKELSIDIIKIIRAFFKSKKLDFREIPTDNIQEKDEILKALKISVFDFNEYISKEQQQLFPDYIIDWLNQFIAKYEKIFKDINLIIDDDDVVVEINNENNIFFEIEFDLNKSFEFFEILKGIDISDYSEFNKSAIKNIKIDAPLIERLVEFLSEYLNSDEKRRLLNKLKSDYHYEGNDYLILCEYCLKENPERILEDHFTIGQLQNISKTPNTPNDKPKIIKDILLDMGYIIPEGMIGITDIKIKMENIYLEINRTAMLQNKIEKARTACEYIEKIILSLIIFYGKILFGNNYKEDFNKSNRQFFSKEKGMTFGVLFDLLKDFQKKCLENMNLNQKLVELFNRNYLITEQAEILEKYSDVVKYRNDLSHHDRSDEQKKIAVDKAVKLSLKFISHLDANNIFPKLIRIEQIIIDSYGRKKIECIDERGITEQIYTNENIDYTKNYFMHPLNNPLRIFPLLVEKE